MDARRMQEGGVRLGLGSDCSAGYSPSVLENMRFAVATSNQVHIGKCEEGLEHREIHLQCGGERQSFEHEFAEKICWIFGYKADQYY